MDVDSLFSMADGLFRTDHDGSTYAAYAGVGSRQTPQEMQDLMAEIAERLSMRGFTLRSGAAPGADLAFERGAVRVQGKTEIYIPWPRFNGHDSHRNKPPQLGFDVAAKFHPGWPHLSQAARTLMARNVQQVLGPDCQGMGGWASRFVLCWTADGATSKTTWRTGGTGQAIRIAAEWGIPVFNLAREEMRQQVCKTLEIAL